MTDSELISLNIVIDHVLDLHLCFPSTWNEGVGFHSSHKLLEMLCHYSTARVAMFVL